MSAYNYTELTKHGVKFLIPLAAGGLGTLLFTKHFERRDERRKLFAQACQSVLAWQEMLYRVRRRAPGLEVERQLVDRFHEIQEDLNYYQAIISSESKSLGKSYQQLVKAVKRDNVTLIQEAWEARLRRPKDGTPTTDSHPHANAHADLFLADTRRWMSWWQLPKFAVLWRNK